MKNMDKLKQTMVIALVAVIVVAAGGWHFLISPQRSSVASLNAQSAAVVTSNKSIQDQIDQLKSQLADVPGEQRALAVIAKRLPADLQEANLLDDLSHAADAANVDLLTITPAAPVLATPAVVAAPAPVASAAGKSGAATVPRAPVAASNQLYQIPVSLTVTGNYFDLEMYIHTLEGMQRAMLINQLAFAKGTDTASTTGSNTLTGGAAASGAPTSAGAVTTAPATTVTKTTGKSSTAKTKGAKSAGKPVPGSAAAAQAELDRQVQVLADSDTLTVTITGEVFSMYSPAAAAAAAATAATATPAPTK